MSYLSGKKNIKFRLKSLFARGFNLCLCKHVSVMSGLCTENVAWLSKICASCKFVELHKFVCRIMQPFNSIIK